MIETEISKNNLSESRKAKPTFRVGFAFIGAASIAAVELKTDLLFISEAIGNPNIKRL